MVAYLIYQIMVYTTFIRLSVHFSIHHHIIHSLILAHSRELTVIPIVNNPQTKPPIPSKYSTTESTRTDEHNSKRSIPQNSFFLCTQPSFYLQYSCIHNSRFIAAPYVASESHIRVYQSLANTFLFILHSSRSWENSKFSFNIKNILNWVLKIFSNM